MRTSLDCLPCLVRQIVEVARLAGDDDAASQAVVQRALAALADLELNAPPPVLTRHVQRVIRAVTGDPNPYAGVKRQANETVMLMLPELRAQIAGAEDPLLMAVRLAIAANTIDAGANGLGSTKRGAEALAAAARQPLHGDIAALRDALESAEDVLYLTDNAGEIFLDRLLAERLTGARLTFVVRGAPVLNDATVEDARLAGLDQLGELIDNGSDVPGTLLADCSAELRRRWDSADLVIAKGQGNYETLNEEGREIFFLFRAKCEMVAGQVGAPQGTYMLLRSPAGDR